MKTIYDYYEKNGNHIVYAQKSGDGYIAFHVQLVPKGITGIDYGEQVLETRRFSKVGAPMKKFASKCLNN